MNFVDQGSKKANLNIKGLIFNKTIKSFYWSRVSGSVASPPKNAVNIFLWRVLVQETNPLFPAGKKRFRLKAGRLKAF